MPLWISKNTWCSSFGYWKNLIRAPRRSPLLFQKKFEDLQGAKVEGIEVEVKIEVKIEVEVCKVEGKWRIEDCYQNILWIDNEALGGNEVLPLLDVKMAAD
jgi:hypothetical protein